MLERKLFKSCGPFIILLICAFAVFSMTFFNSNFFWDDEKFLFMNPDFIQAPHVFSFWDSDTRFNKAWPVGYAFFYSLIKLSPFQSVYFYKTVNILLHTINGYIVYRILKKYRCAYPLFLSLFFLVHPLHVETISWTMQMMTILSFTSFLGATYLVIKYIHTERIKFLIAGILIFLISLWTKSMAIFGPIIFIFMFWFHKKPLKKYLLLIPFFLISGYIGIKNIEGANFMLGKKDFKIIDFSIGEKKEVPKDDHTPVPVVENIPRLEMPERMNIFLNGLWHYLEKLFFPIDLKFIYPKKEINFFLLAISIGLLLALPIVLWIKHSDRVFIFPTVLFFSFLLPFLGLSYITYFYLSYYADRYTYYAVLIVPIVLILLLNSKRITKNMLKCYLGFLVILSLVHGYIFNHPITLYNQILGYFSHPVIYYELAEEYLKRGDIIEAKGAIQEGLEKFPSDISLNKELQRYNGP